jgi:hypothetical protein
VDVPVDEPGQQRGAARVDVTLGRRPLPHLDGGDDVAVDLDPSGPDAVDRVDEKSP